MLIKWNFVHKNFYTSAWPFSRQEGELMWVALNLHLRYCAKALSYPRSDLSLTQITSNFTSAYLIDIQSLYIIKGFRVMFWFTSVVDCVKLRVCTPYFELYLLGSFVFHTVHSPNCDALFIHHFLLIPFSAKGVETSVLI